MRMLAGGRVTVKTGDLTLETTDAIVNAANSGLLGGGGVDGAIHRAGGPEILAACRRIRQTGYPEGLPPGNAVLTTGGMLSARFVIHTVGPVWRGGGAGEDALLAAAYTNSLRLAATAGCVSVAFPAISTGVYGFPPGRAAGIVSRVLAEYLSTGSPLSDIRLVFFEDAHRDVFLQGCTLPA